MHSVKKQHYVLVTFIYFYSFVHFDCLIFFLNKATQGTEVFAEIVSRTVRSSVVADFVFLVEINEASKFIM